MCRIAAPMQRPLQSDIGTESDWRNAKIILHSIVCKYSEGVNW